MRYMVLLSREYVRTQIVSECSSVSINNRCNSGNYVMLQIVTELYFFVFKKLKHQHMRYLSSDFIK